MRGVNRRDAARLAAAGLGVGLGLVESDPTQAQAEKVPTKLPERVPTDRPLEQAQRSPEGFMMVEQAATRLPGSTYPRERLLWVRICVRTEKLTIPSPRVVLLFSPSTAAN